MPDYYMNALVVYFDLPSTAIGTLLSQRVNFGNRMGYLFGSIIDHPLSQRHGPGTVLDSRAVRQGRLCAGHCIKLEQLFQLCSGNDNSVRISSDRLETFVMHRTQSLVGDILAARFKRLMGNRANRRLLSCIKISL